MARMTGTLDVAARDTGAVERDGNFISARRPEVTAESEL
jgi:hypothetical protein